MKTFLRSSKSVLALLLIFCLLASTLSGINLMALAVETRAGGDPISVRTADELKTAIDMCNKSGGGTITLKESAYELYEPLTISTIITIQATVPCLIQCAGSNWTTGHVPENSTFHNSLIYIQGEYGRLTIENNITIDPREKCRAVSLSDKAQGDGSFVLVIYE